MIAFIVNFSHDSFLANEKVGIELAYRIMPNSSINNRWKNNRCDGCYIQSKKYVTTFTVVHGNYIALSSLKEKLHPNYIRHHFKGAENIGDII